MTSRELMGIIRQDLPHIPVYKVSDSYDQYTIEIAKMSSFGPPQYDLRDLTDLLNEVLPVGTLVTLAVQDCFPIHVTLLGFQNEEEEPKDCVARPEAKWKDIQ